MMERGRVHKSILKWKIKDSHVPCIVYVKYVVIMKVMLCSYLVNILVHVLCVQKKIEKCVVCRSVIREKMVVFSI